MATRENALTRRHFCLCCVSGATFASTGGWLTPRQAFGEARGLVSLIKDSAATSLIVTHKLRNNIAVLEGSGGTVAVLTGSDGKVLIDAGIAISRPQLTAQENWRLRGLSRSTIAFEFGDGNTGQFVSYCRPSNDAAAIAFSF
jgi:hypothetical protein